MASIDKRLPALPVAEAPSPRMQPTTSTSNLSERESIAQPPPIPLRNPRRYSFMESDSSFALPSALRPLRRTSSAAAIPSPMTDSFEDSIHNWRHDSSTPKPLQPKTHQSASSAVKIARLTGHDLFVDPSPSMKLKHPSPISVNISKVQQLMGYDLSSDISPANLPNGPYSNTPYSSSEIFYGSSCGTDEVSPSSDYDRKESIDSTNNIVDSYAAGYSGWGSWSPSDASHPPPPHHLNLPTMGGIKDSEVLSPSSISRFPNHAPPRPTTSEEGSSSLNSPTISSARVLFYLEVPIPAGSQTKVLSRPETIEPIPWRTSYLKQPSRGPTIEHLIAQERSNFESTALKSPGLPRLDPDVAPSSPLTRVSVLTPGQLKQLRDSGFATHTETGREAGEERLGRPLRRHVRQQPSLPVLPGEWAQVKRSESRFSDNSSGDGRSVRSVASARIVSGAMNIRESFMGAVRGIGSRPGSARSKDEHLTVPAKCRLSKLSDNNFVAESNGSNGRSSTIAAPAAYSPPYCPDSLIRPGHNRTASSATTQSIAASMQCPTLSPRSSLKKPPQIGDQKLKSMSSILGMTRIFSRQKQERQASELVRRRSKRHHRSFSGPASSSAFGTVTSTSIAKPALGRIVGLGHRKGPASLGAFPSKLPEERVAEFGESRVDLHASPHESRGRGAAREQEVEHHPGNLARFSRMAGHHQEEGVREEERPMRAFTDFSQLQTITPPTERKVKGIKAVKSAPAQTVAFRSRLESTFTLPGSAKSASVQSLPPPLPPSPALGSPRDSGDKEGAERRGLGMFSNSLREMNLERWKRRVGVKSKEEKRREQLKGLIKVVDEKAMVNGRPHGLPQVAPPSQMEDKNVGGAGRATAVAPRTKPAIKVKFQGVLGVGEIGEGQNGLEGLKGLGMRPERTDSTAGVIDEVTRGRTREAAWV